MVDFERELKVNLLELLKTGLKDHRRGQGKRHPIEIVVMIILMGIMGGAKSERGIERFANNNRKELVEELEIERGEVPSRRVMREVIEHTDFKELGEIFYNWSKESIGIEKGDWMNIDGKAIRGTVTDKSSSLQDFVSLVSVFASKKKQVLSAGMYKVKEGHELSTARELIECVDLQGVTLTLDALHCQAETVKVIVESENDYVVGVKGNQAKLFEQVQQNCEKEWLVDIDTSEEKNRGRNEERTCSIYENLEGIDIEKWVGLKSVIKVERKVTIKEKETFETAYFISSLPATTLAKELNEGIRGHWSIESFHYIKDVTFGEDAWKVKKKNAAANYSLIRNISINIFRNNGLHRIREAIEKCANNVPFMLRLLSLF
jgi:predicted transposase YbfD/YdcC